MTEPKTNLQAAKTGKHLAALETLRDTLAKQLDTTETATHAQLAGQYRATLADIAVLKGEQAPGATGEVASKATKGQKKTESTNGTVLDAAGRFAARVAGAQSPTTT